MSLKSKERNMKQGGFTLDRLELLAEAIAEILDPGDIICLTGDLGAGKTTFSQAICKALGVTDYVTSPTFSIMNAYGGKFPVYHFDVYRIDDPDEMIEIGLDDFLFGHGICLIEWAGKIESMIPKEAIWVHLSVEDIYTRSIEIKSDKWHTKWETLNENFSN